MRQFQMTNSVIVCTRNRPHDVQRCLLSLSKQTVPPTELIIVDSSDEPLQHHALLTDTFNAATFPHSTLIYQHTKPGLTYQRNVGINLARGEIIYFFDDDVILAHDYLQEMEHVFITHPFYAGGMGSITNMPPKKQSFNRALRHLFFLQRDYASGNFTPSGMPTHAYGSTTFKNVEVLGGCCMAFRATTFACHRFDETLSRYAYMEDADISHRICQESSLFFNPRAQLEHHNSPIARDAVVANRAMFIRNYRYLFFKNIYPKNRLKIIAYYWSIVGLFVEAAYTRNVPALKGYWQGLLGS